MPQRAANGKSIRGAPRPAAAEFAGRLLTIANGRDSSCPAAAFAGRRQRTAGRLRGGILAPVIRVMGQWAGEKP
jgi:hypothetical protein